MNGCINSFMNQDIVNLPNMGSKCIACFLNSTAKNLSLNLCKEKYTRSRKICQLSNDTKCSRVSFM